MSTIEDSSAMLAGTVPTSRRRHIAWEYLEIVIGYGLIIAVIWTPRPVQHWLYWAAVAWFLGSTCFAFPGWREMGCTIVGFWRSFWVVALALVFAFTAGMFASNLHTLHHPGGAVAWVRAFAGYAVWATLQQMLLQGYFLLRLLRILPNRKAIAATIAASVFALAHLPNPILTPVTLLWGLTACFVFLRQRNIWPLAMAHAIFGICLAVTIPGPVLHNMRVGLGYLTYRAPARLHLSQRPHIVSTVAWVREEAPTRLLARQARP